VAGAPAGGSPGLALLGLLALCVQRRRRLGDGRRVRGIFAGP
jgi:MYXO-CTERM domain-containing protein